jgi:hypothetical protein
VKCYGEYGRMPSSSENIRIMQKKIVKRYEKYGKKSRLNSEMIWKIQKKILK